MIKTDKFVLVFERFKGKKIDEKTLEKAFSMKGVLGELTEDFKLLIAMIRDALNGKYDMDKGDMGIIVAGIIYVVSPIDAIPDVLGFVGLIDDAWIIGYILNLCSDSISKYKKFKSEEENDTKGDEKNDTSNL